MASAWWVAVECVRTINFLSVFSCWNLFGNDFFFPFLLTTLWFCSIDVTIQFSPRSSREPCLWERGELCNSSIITTCHTVALQLLLLIISSRGKFAQQGLQVVLVASCFCTLLKCKHFRHQLDVDVFYSSTNSVKKTTPPVAISKIDQKLEQYNQALEVTFLWVPHLSNQNKEFTRHWLQLCNNRV